MREIKFRGKCKETGEWVYGGYLKTKISGVYIIGTETKATQSIIRDVVWQHEVDPETVGQYTCLPDKHDNEIYEGDAHKWLGVVAIVKYSDLHAKFLWGKDDLSHGIASDGEVIGNIHDDPGLLEEATP